MMIIIVMKIDCNSMNKSPSRIDFDRNLISRETNKRILTTKKGTEIYIKVTIVKAIIFSISSEGIYSLLLRSHIYVCALLVLILRAYIRYVRGLRRVY